MFGYKDTKRQLFEEKKKNAELQAKLAKTNADVEYIAMMTDIELDETESEENVE